MSTGPRQALADTSVLIDWDTERVAQHADAVAVPMLAIAELQYGVTADDDPIEQQRRRRRIQDTLDRCEVVPFDLEAAELYGALCTLARQHGRNPRGRRMDLMIAATAARHRLPLLTHNAEDFTGLESAVTVVDVTSRGN